MKLRLLIATRRRLGRLPCPFGWHQWHASGGMDVADGQVTTFIGWDCPWCGRAVTVTRTEAAT